MQKLLLFLVFSLSSFANNHHHALYLMHIGEVEKAIDSYQKNCLETNTQDFEILRQMAMTLLKEGAKSADAEIQMLSFYGAGLALSSSSLEILEKGLFHPDPQIQLISLFFLSKIHDNKSDELLSSVAMSSEFLSTRMEACFHMAMRKHPHAVGHTEALMLRLPPFFRPFFPPFFAQIGTSDAIAILKTLLEDYNPLVRVQSILSIISFSRDDLLPIIRKKLLQTHIAEVEAAALATGYLQDTSSLERLIDLSEKGVDHVKLAALKALYSLGKTEVKQKIEIWALSHNLFAIQALSDIFGSEDTLAELLHVNNIQVRINAALALLKRKDPRCISALKEFFIQDTRGLAFQPQVSLGSAHHAIKVLFSSDQRKKDPLVELRISLSLREQYLQESMNLEEKDFLKIAKMIFQSRQNDLIPTLIRFLENLQTKNAIDLLKEQAETMGAPFIRDYCNLALFRLKEEGPYEARVIQWLNRENKKELIRLKEPLPLQDRMQISEYTLSAEEKSQLLIDTFSAFASCQDEKSIQIVLNAFKEGNPKNRYVLCGLLMRSTE